MTENNKAGADNTRQNDHKRDSEITTRSNTTSRLNEFLEALFPNEDEPIHLRFLDCKEVPKNLKRPPQKLVTSRAQIASHLPQIIAANKQQGIYFVVNSGGDKNSEI